MFCPPLLLASRSNMQVAMRHTAAVGLRVAGRTITLPLSERKNPRDTTTAWAIQPQQQQHQQLPGPVRQSGGSASGVQDWAAAALQTVEQAASWRVCATGAIGFSAIGT